MSGLKIDGRPIRVEMDWGFSDGRQYGRAVDGGQMRYYINDIKNSAKGGNRKRSDYSRDDRRDNGYRDNRRRERYDRQNSDYRRRDRNDSYDNKRRRNDY